MKWVLLPGMDGTGLLLADLLPELLQHELRVKTLAANDILVLSLPMSGPQDYATLAEHIRPQLPKTDFMLLAESFSGGIAARLALQGCAHLQGVVFVAAFLSAPTPRLVQLAACLPLARLARLPLSSWLFRGFFLGFGATPEQIKACRQAITAVPASILKARLQVIARSQYHYQPMRAKSHIPAVYIQARHDRLIAKHKYLEFKQAFANIRLRTLSGPHFILQAQPKESALCIINAFKLLSDK